MQVTDTNVSAGEIRFYWVVTPARQIIHAPAVLQPTSQQAARGLKMNKLSCLVHAGIIPF